MSSTSLQRSGLVETNKGEAWIRYGESHYKMREEEKQDFRATRQELAFELSHAPYNYPQEFDLRVIQDFLRCLQVSGWTAHLDTNEEVLIDRHLLKKDGAVLVPLNSLVLMAASRGA